ncbi:copper-transporting ATPase [Thraustotheca clavata]|uniref:P-type Cu(+) transporter n=1 Tax=Thraustotheca clavata TaxID=74557 RepID=A0A1W0A310_9STRA|nr:copper-transporting ATPase [Thraustotheca clavata]
MMKTREIELVIEGMRCQKICAKRIQGALKAVPGVENASVSFKGKQAIVTLTDGAYAPVVDLINAVRDLDAGANKQFNAYLPNSNPSTRMVYLHVVGMSCAMKCGKTVETALQEVNGVECASVDFPHKLAVVTVKSDSRVTGEDLVAKIEGIKDKKFTAYVVKAYDELVATRISSSGPAIPSPLVENTTGADVGDVTLSLIGMTCNSCANSVETALKQTDGVVSAVVNFATESAYVKFTKNVIGIRSLVEVVESLGYGATVATGSITMASNENRKVGIADWKRRLYISLFFTIPIVVIMTILDNIGRIRSELQRPVFGIAGITWDSFAPFVLATPVQFYAGLKFHKEAIKGIRNRVLGMSFLVSMGTNAAYFYGLFSDIRCIYLKNNSYSVPDMYMTSAMLITFIVLGKTLEAIAKGRTNDALYKLFDLQAKVATMMLSGADGNLVEHVVPIELVQQGDILKVVRGGSVPADGIITFGEGHLDESMLTGESQLIKKQVGATVLGATVNADGLFHMRVTGVGKDTALSQIVRLVEDAQTSKVPIQAFADKIASVFVPIVVGLSLLTFIVWYILASSARVSVPSDSNNFLFSFNFAISTLVIACPCALGLAIPTAVMVGTGVGASHGILIKGGEPLEIAHKVNTVLFDKTGTLTMGSPTVTDVIVINDEYDANTLIMLAASAELGSEHPLGQAIVNYAKLLSKPLEQPQVFHAVSGKGICVELNDEIVYLGNSDYMDESGMKKQASIINHRSKLEQSGTTVIYMGICDTIVALIGISDAPRPDAMQTVAYLHELGMEVYMVTGDNYRSAYYIAEQIGIPTHHIMAEVLPSNKVAKVSDLQSQGRIVAMVGDGINDAPALAQANVGIAIGAGTDIAIESASMVLMKSKLQDVVTALDLSKTVYRRILWNFGWALGYNLVLVPLAGGVFYSWSVVIPPMFAGAAMALSSVSVVISSLLLKWYSPPKMPQAPAITTHQDDFSYIEASSPVANIV